MLRDLIEPSPTAGRLPKMGERKQTNYMNDFMHWARLSGVEIGAEAGKLRGIEARPALRTAIAAKQLGGFDAFHHATYRARWSEGRDISQSAELESLLAGAGLDVEAAMDIAASDEVDRQLSGQTQAAIDRGVFGVPTIFVGDEMFWGNDRFELVRMYVSEAIEVAGK